MKKFIIVSLCFFVVAIAIYAQKSEQAIEETISLLSNDDVIATERDPECISGGIGTKVCSISENSLILFTCSIECAASHYACCGIDGCSCKKIVKQKA